MSGSLIEFALDVTLRHWGKKSLEHTGSLLKYGIVQDQEEMKKETVRVRKREAL
jgi:hypothetical protein